MPAPSQRLKFLNDHATQRAVAAVELRALPRAARLRLRADDLRACPVLEDGVRQEGKEERDAERKQVEAARKEAQDEVRGRELRVLHVGEQDTDLIEARSVEHFEGLADSDEVGRVVEVEERVAEFRCLDITFREYQSEDKEKDGTQNAHSGDVFARKALILTLRCRCIRPRPLRVLDIYFKCFCLPWVTSAKSSPMRRRG